MTQLRERMLEELQRGTILPRVDSGSRSELLRKSPALMGAVRRFQLYLLKEKKLAASTVQCTSALRFPRRRADLNWMICPCRVHGSYRRSWVRLKFDG